MRIMNSSCSLTFLWFAGREESNFDNKRLAKFGELRKQKTWNSSPSKLVSVLCSSEAMVRMLDNFCMKRIAYKLVKTEFICSRESKIQQYLEER